MLAVVLFSFAGKGLLAVKDISNPDVYYPAPEWPVDQDMKDYIAEVEQHLADYPLEGEIPEEVTDTDFEKVPLTFKAKDSSASTGIPGRVSEKIRHVEKQVERYTNSEKIAGKYGFVALKKKLDRLLGLDMTNSVSGGQNSQTDNRDLIAETEEGQLGWIQDSYSVRNEAATLADFGLRMKEQGRNFVILEPPVKYAQVDGYRNYAEDKYAFLHNSYAAYGLDQLIAGDLLKAEGLTESDIFFNTDFHWKPSAGILADGLLASYLNERCGYSIDLSLFDPGNYHVETEEKSFMGFMGKKVTAEYVEPDDFPIWYPDYETNMEVSISYFSNSRTGTIPETLFWYDQLDTANLYTGNKYQFYGYGDQALIRIHNNLVQDGKRLLMIKTSYANCMYPYLGAAIENLDVIDLRAFGGSIQKYIEETDPDTVVVVYGLSSYQNFDKEGSLFDFR